MKMAIFADDLTGANATGVQISKQGLSTMTVVRGTELPDQNFDVLCFDTDSRYDPPQVAKDKLDYAMHAVLDNNRPQFFCKRIDSTLRGNIGAEIDTMLDLLGPEFIAVVVASFPESDRVTIGDYLLVDGLLLQESEVANDPIAPIRSSRVTDIIAEQSNYDISTIGLDDVLEGSDVLRTNMQKQMDDGARILVIDATTDEQIDTISTAMHSLNESVIAVDPGPLTSALASVSFEKDVPKSQMLVTVGSVTDQTHRQLNYFIDKRHLHPVYVDPHKLATFTDGWEREVARAVQHAHEKVRSGSTIVVTTCHPDVARVPFKQIAAEENVSEESLAKRVTDGLATISQEIIRQYPDAIGGCFLSGGDLTASFCGVSYANGIELADEVMPRAAYGYLRGGDLDGMPVVTKGGTVGTKEALDVCVQFLSSKVSSNKKEAY